MIQLCKECLQGLAALPLRLVLVLAFVGAAVITALTLPHQTGGFTSEAVTSSGPEVQSSSGGPTDASAIAAGEKDASRAGSVPSQTADDPGGERSFSIDDPVVRSNGSIRFKDQSVFLSEIDRFTSKDLCTRASGERWACGLHAYATLQNSIAKKQIRCVERSTTGSNIEASCEYDGKNLALLLLDRGLARLRSGIQDAGLIAAQDAAKVKHLGIWDR